ncbi:ribonuclease P protein subunit p20-like [Macrobrachium rosenbergii]|uniref:ribonuclease P protein subunit p20-like n=1 Tax=Macrobrachium rosenbergii TaxID=79674 RepID=UPI0034D52AD8
MAAEVGDSLICISSPGGGINTGKGVNIPIGPEEQALSRLLPRYLPRHPNHIYVSANTDFKNQFLRGKTILSSGEDFVIVHGLGTGMERAINLAHEIKNAIPRARLAASTSGFHVSEELGFMLTGDRQTRSSTVIHMKISVPPKQEDNKGTGEVKGT